MSSGNTSVGGFCLFFVTFNFGARLHYMRCFGACEEPNASSKLPMILLQTYVELLTLS